MLAAATMMPVGSAVIANEALPYTDPNAAGSIGFCNKNKRPVTSGSLYDQPFVWTAVSSTRAPEGYGRGKAVLLAYQPRRDVDPGLWSGRQLTAASSFTNPAHPMAQATYGDDPLLFFTQAFPPKWEGLVQLRMYFGGPNMPQHRTSYPATTIRVRGDRWSVVDGGTVACNVGTATSDETRVLPKSALASPAPLTVKGSKRASTQAGEAAGAEADASGVPVGAPDDEGSAGGLVALGLLAVALVGSGVSGLSVWRRRRTTLT